jgi:hypothetical protein
VAARVRTLPGLAAQEEAALPCRTQVAVVVAAGALLLAREGFVLPVAERARKVARSRIPHYVSCVWQVLVAWVRKREREPDSTPCRTR